MRILRLTDADGVTVELHPNVTVFTSLSTSQHDALVDTFRSIAAGIAGTHAGLIEAHGVALDADDASLGLLGLGDANVDVYVGPGGLHSHADAVDGGTPPDSDERTDRIREIGAALALFDTFDVAAGEVEAALDALRLEPAAGASVPSIDARELGDAIRHLRRRLEELEAEAAGDEPGGEAVERAGEELAQIRAQLLIAEEEAEPSGTDGAVAELEAAHAEVVEAAEALESRFAGSRARRRHEEAVAAQEAVLDRLGIRSYLDFMTGGRAKMGAAEVSEEIRALRRREREVVEQISELEDRRARAAELTALATELRETTDAARSLLDDVDGRGDGDLVGALYELRVPADGRNPIQRLGDALEAVGLPVAGFGLDPTEIETLAIDWLDEHWATAATPSALEAELVSLESPGPETDVDRIEQSLRFRLDRHRRVCLAGSVPVVFDHALDALDDDVVTMVCERIERMAGPVQVIHLTDDTRVIAWAETAGEDRVAVVVAHSPMASSAGAD